LQYKQIFILLYIETKVGVINDLKKKKHLSSVHKMVSASDNVSHMDIKLSGAILYGQVQFI